MSPDFPAPTVVRLTPPGRGAIASVRVEGAGGVEIVQSLFHARDGTPLTEHPADRFILGRFEAEEIVVRLNGGDAVELHCHGGTAAVERIEETLESAGCRRMNWRDWAAERHANPTAAAALTALADARTERTAAILLDQLNGAWDRAVAAIHGAIDRSDLAAARQSIDALAAREELGRHLIKPWSVVLAGRPNVGKSSTLNALAGYRRAIVHHAPGTTRDAVTLTTAIDGWPVELCDTAGLRADAEPIERAGVELARTRLRQADLRVLIFDRAEPWSEADRSLPEAWPDALLVHNKSDLAAASGARPPGLSLSALTGEGVPSLIEAISARLVPDPPAPGDAVPLTPDHIETLRKLAESCNARKG